MNLKNYSQLLLLLILLIYSCNRFPNEKNYKVLVEKNESIYFNFNTLENKSAYYFSSKNKKHGLYIEKDNQMRITSKKIYNQDILLMEKRYAFSEPFDTIKWIKYESKNENGMKKLVVTELLKYEK